MHKVLINAYACSPHTGSEPGMAWNWCIHLAKHCELHIVTEGEFRAHIEEALKSLPQAKNMHFYYNPVSEEVRKMCWNQGDWRFYKHYKKWQYKTYQLALKIRKEEQIDIVHQLNMIGFREPGYLWKIQEIPFVWGPIGGLKQFPVNYLKGVSLKMNFFVRLKNFINIKQLQYDKRVNKALKRADVLVSSIPDSYRAIKKYKGLESVVIPETGCFVSKDIQIDRFEKPEFKVIWVGKFDFRKQLPLALKAIEATQNKNIKLHVYGTGTETQETEAKELASTIGIENQILWHGNQPNSVVQDAMNEAQLFFFTSVSEDTSTVVLEALSNCLPVLCFDACGFGYVIYEKVGKKIPLSNPSTSITQFAEQLNYLYNNRDELKRMSHNCIERQRELSWDTKAKTMVELYDKI
ncbi:glycosyltransferase [Zobellia roscoffensis]|uniref:glycosyltransferase family 4 protein n=1 Tax=Zobellia roscoffensis TaxID=2779508 RepID=UPI00188A8D74|nr:glycosyltransferase [Zobellia roscoffensis]